MKNETKTTIETENIHKDHRQRVRSKFIAGGLDGFAEHEILELLLFYSIPLQDTNPTAHRLINRFGSLNKVFQAPYDSLVEIKGVGETTAALIKLVPAIMQECNKLDLTNLVLKNQLMAVDYFAGIYRGSPNEKFYVLCLNADNKVIDVKEMNSGSATKVDIKIRTITAYCLQQNCERIIISHNHPQADPRPSNEDVIMTEKIFSSCVLNDIDIVDHIIIAPDGYYSFAESGILKTIKEDVVEAMKFNLTKQQYQKFSSPITNYKIIKKK